MIEDIKKAMAYLRKQNPNIKVIERLKKGTPSARAMSRSAVLQKRVLQLDQIR
jgi:hypothetical protein